jgi:hypothetical protein
MADLRIERASRQQAEDEVARGAVSLKAHSAELEQRTRTIDLLGRMANRLPGFDFDIPRIICVLDPAIRIAVGHPLARNPSVKSIPVGES